MAGMSRQRVLGSPLEGLTLFLPSTDALHAWPCLAAQKACPRRKAPLPMELQRKSLYFYKGTTDNIRENGDNLYRG
jgi:hypothetical protein